MRFWSVSGSESLPRSLTRDTKRRTDVGPARPLLTSEIHGPGLVLLHERGRALLELSEEVEGSLLPVSLDVEANLDLEVRSHAVRLA